MSRWLPPAGGGYSGRSANSGRYVTKSTAARSPKTTVKEKTSKNGKSGTVYRSANTGRFVRVSPKGKGSAGVSRAK